MNHTIHNAGTLPGDDALLRPLPPRQRQHNTPGPAPGYTRAVWARHPNERGPAWEAVFTGPKGTPHRGLVRNRKRFT